MNITRKKRGGSAFPALLLLPVLAGCGSSGMVKHNTDLFAMDTYMNLKVWADEDSAILTDLTNEILRVQSELSVTEEDSLTYRFNHRTSDSVEGSQEICDLLADCLAVSEKTDGALNLCLFPLSEAWGFSSTSDGYHVLSQEECRELLTCCDWTRLSVNGNTVSSDLSGLKLDLGAVGKGYVTDTCAAILKENGVTDALLNLGGNVYAMGKNPEKDRAWNVAIQDPSDETGSSYIGAVSVSDLAVVTSGNYQRYFEENGVRYCHILDPMTGAPCDNGLDSVTVISERGLLADALSTALFVKGLEQGAEYWRHSSDSFSCIWITSDGEIHATEDLKDSFEPLDGKTVDWITKE